MANEVPDANFEELIARASNGLLSQQEQYSKCDFTVSNGVYLQLSLRGPQYQVPRA